jgi:hypothetical protein
MKNNAKQSIEKEVRVVIEAGSMHVGIDKKGNFIMQDGPRKEFTFIVSSKIDALRKAMDLESPKGRMMRVFDGDREIIMNADF